MLFGSARSQRFLPFIAALACLQAGIDPVFLSLLSLAGAVAPSAHGLVVGFSQAGAAVGALVVWRFGKRIPHGAGPAAAAVAILCSIATPAISSLLPMLIVRFGYGLAMGAVYTGLMARYARQARGRAYGSVFLLQLILSALAAFLLPLLVELVGVRIGLLVLVTIPAGALLGMLVEGRGQGAGGATLEDTLVRNVPAEGARENRPLAAATFFFICATMLVWSFSGAMALEAGFDEAAIGGAVSLGSLAGAATAAGMIRKPPSLPLPLTALLAGLALATPVFLIGSGGTGMLIGSIALLNIGSTAIIIRCSEQAAATSRSVRFDAFVACTHPLGMIAGPLLGSAMVFGQGARGLPIAMLVTLCGGFSAVLLGMRLRQPPLDPDSFEPTRALLTNPGRS